MIRMPSFSLSALSLMVVLATGAGCSSAEQGQTFLTSLDASGLATLRVASYDYVLRGPGGKEVRRALAVRGVLEGAPCPRRALLAVAGREVVAILDKDGTVVRQRDWSGTAENLCWSPDGTRIAFQTGRSQHGSDVILLAASDLHELARVPGASAPSWGADSERLLCVRNEEVGVVDLRTERFAPISGGKWANWAPDGKLMLIRDAAGALWLREGGSGKTEKVLRDQEVLSGPQWSDDGRLWLFVIPDQGLARLLDWRCVEAKRLVARDWRTGQEAVLDRLCKSPTMLRFDWVRADDWGL
jgi:dipeptidyl aminopeptidase/acylaminoacyl peptidase